MDIETNSSTQSLGYSTANGNINSGLKENISENKEDETAHKIFSPPLVPPDGGWGWAIVFGNFLVSFVNSTILYGFGIVYIYLIQVGYANTVVAIIPALMNGLSNLLAPLSTGLSRYYSNRRLTITGNVLISAGLFLCSFSSHIIWFYICYGVILGLGNALLQPQGFLLSQQYFNKRRVAANGLSMTGQSIGFMVIPLLIHYFIQEYSYSGAFILWSGIVLHGIIGASLFQPVTWHMKPQMTIPLHQIKVYRKETSEKGLEADFENDSEVSSDSSESDVYSRVSSQRGESHSYAFNSKSNSNNQVRVRDSENSESENEDTFDEIHEKIKDFRERTRTMSYKSSSNAVFGTYEAIEGFGSCISVDNKNGITNEETMERAPGEQETKALDHFLLCGITFPRLKNMINFKLIKHPAFLVSSLSSVANRVVYMCFVTYLPAIANEIGVGESAPYLFSCIALFELIAKIIMSLISDRGWIERRYYLILGSFTSSIAICSITFATGFWEIAFGCCLYGLSVGTAMSVGPVLLVEYLGVNLLPYSFGLLLFMNGIAGLILFTITGALNDIAGNYIVTYWVISILVFIPGILWSMINCFLKGYKSDAEEILHA